MSPIRIKLLVGGLVLAGAVTYLALAGTRRGWVYYVTVDDFTQPGAEFSDQRVRLTGLVAQDGLKAKPGLLNARFDLAGDTRRIPVSYRGAVPDMFKPGAQVVVEGTLDQTGVFQADKLLTKCASKYEAQPAGHVNTSDGD